MFNGIIFNQGVVTKITKRPKGNNIFIKSNLKLNSNNIGISVACDGVCLTLISKKNKILSFYLSYETIKRSNFSKDKVGKIINLEKSLKFGYEVSGHYTQGHVDTIGKIQKIKIIDKTWFLKISIPTKYNKFVIEKASIHINGVSLTVSKKTKKFFEISIIPHTLKLTNLKNLKEKDLLNIEFDIFGKYLYEINN